MKAKPRTRTPTAKPKRADATSPAIETLFAELESDPANAGTTLVLADALAELGDTRSELVYVQLALAKASRVERPALLVREAALIHALRLRLLGPRLAPQPEITVEVRLGFAREVGLFNMSAAELEGALSTILRSDDARLLESLHLASDDEKVMGLGTVFRRLASELPAPSAIRRLKLGNAFERDAGDRLVEEPGYDEPDREEDLRPVLTLFPRLRELVLDLGIVPAKLSTLATKNLETLTWITPFLLDHEIAPLSHSILPGLRRFELWIGGASHNDEGSEEEPGDDLDLESMDLRHLAPLLAMLDRCQHLRELAFGHCYDLEELLAMLEAHPLVRRLETLELSNVEIDDAEIVLDFMHEIPTLGLVLHQTLATERTATSLERRLGSRLVAEWSKEPRRFRYLTGYE